jgi:hypothetical protein
MTTGDLDCIDRALSVLVIHDGYSTGAKSAALRFNSQIQEERSRFECARATHEHARAVSLVVEIELRASAVMYEVERERIVRLWNIRLRPRVARGDNRSAHEEMKLERPVQ